MKACTSPTLRIVVLAAGFSTRLGKPKALARVHGDSLLNRTLAVLAPCTPPTIMAIVPPRYSRYRIGPHPASVAFIANPNRAAGLSSSVRRGIAAARYSAAVLLLPVDLAHLKSRDIARLIARWRGARRRVVARRVETGAGSPLILPRWLYVSAMEMTGNQGLRDLVRRLPKHAVSLVTLTSAEWDVDTAQDLTQARRRLYSGIAGVKTA